MDNKTPRTFLVPALLATLLLLLPAHKLLADEAKPRYVAGSGADEGDCRNPFRPCRSLLFAANKAGKFDPVLVSAGEYELGDLNNLVVLLSSNLQGGMDAPSHYTRQDTDNVLSTLKGVPPEYREHFQNRGFRVIVDTKGRRIGKAELNSFQHKLSASQQNHSRTDCANGRAGTYPCSNINLLSHLSLSAFREDSASDIWGFVDLNTQREYIIIGLATGAAVVDVSTPSEPVIVGQHHGLSSTWRDVKVYQRWDASAERWRAWAYVSTEASQGLTILDLSELPNGFSDTSSTSPFLTAHNVYLANADYALGTAWNKAQPLLTVAGSNRSGGKYRLYGLDNPAAPNLLDADGNAGYMHDAASIRIRDSRKDSQCTQATNLDSCALIADFNEAEVLIWEVSNPQNPQVMADFSYSGASYVHSGWWSEDGMLLFVQDELDEAYNAQPTTLRIYDMSNLNSPRLLATWRGPSSAIDHNGFARGSRYYMSNYLQGLTVLDVSDPANPQRSAYFDTYPGSNATAFDGAWGVYPFLPSGVIGVSDISSGLYLLEESQSAPAQGSISFSTQYQSQTEGSDIQLVLQRRGGDTGEISVVVELLHLSSSEQDASLDSQRVSWADADSADKTLSLSIAEDSNSEPMELLALRLLSPSGGATLGKPSLSYVAISDVGAQTQLQALSASVSVNNNRALLPLLRKGSAEGAVSVDWQLQTTAGETVESGTLYWDDGDALSKTLDLALPSNGDYQVVYSNAENAQLNGTTVSLNAPVATPTPSPTSPPNSLVSGSGGGGGSLYWLLVALLGLLGIRDRLVKA